MRPFIRTIETLELDGGALCLDFVNTVRSRFETPFHEFLEKPSDWLLWINRIGLIDSQKQALLNKYIEENSLKAEKELKRIFYVRELLYRLFRELARNKVPAEKDITLYNKVLSHSLRHLKIVFDKKIKISDNWHVNSLNLSCYLHPLIKSAYDLLISGNIERLKECRHCGWIYLDKSKNNSRVWCNMKTCGNTEKTKKYYDRNKAASVNKVVL